MTRVTSCVLALALSAAAARGQDEKDQPFRGTGETPKVHAPSAGLTLEARHGLPPLRYNVAPAAVYRTYYVQPFYTPAYSYVGAYPSFSANSAYSFPHPFGLGGYYPPRATGGYRAGWWYW